MLKEDAKGFEIMGIACEISKCFVSFFIMKAEEAPKCSALHPTSAKYLKPCQKQNYTGKQRSSSHLAQIQALNLTQ